MATVSTLPQSRRRKQATYGKPSRNVSAWNLSLDALDEPETTTTSTITTSKEPEKSVKDIYQVQKQATKPPAPKPAKPRTKKQDSWDVPSSDDEKVLLVRRKSPPKVLARRKVAAATQETEPELAPWEKKKTEAALPAKSNLQRRKQHELSPDDQLMSDLTRSLQNEDAALVTPGSPFAEPVVEDIPINTASSPKNTSAAVRLQARKVLSGNKVPSGSGGASKELSPNQKRLADANGTKSDVPRKRVKTGNVQDVQEQDVVMDDAPPVRCASVPKTSPTANEMDIYDLPDSSADESKHTKRKISPRRPIQKRQRRGKLITYSSPRKMESAPARLNEMLPTDTDTTDTTTRSPSMTPSRPSTPHQNSSAKKAPTPETAFQRSATMSPKQAQLWDRLLPSEASEATPSGLRMRELTLNTSKKPTTSQSQPLPGAALAAGRRRTKLVDRLKASAPTSDDGSSDEDESETGMEDVDMDAPETSDRNEDVNTSQSQSSQSQSQTSYTGTSGPKVTYARTRSYLPEDSFEDQLLLGMSGEVPQTYGASSRSGGGKSQAASQKSAFDLDDSEDEDDTSRMPTIHELRAKGGTQRFVDGLGGLLEDVADHNSSARSRRRSAMIEVATKLMEKPFLDKFLRHGYEQQLLAECSAASDQIADFTLAAMIVLMVSGEAPDHIVQSLKQSDVLSWLGRLVANSLDPKKIAKDRQNNMSKSAQTSFVQFASSFAGQESIWGEHKPSSLTPRTLALKAYDLLIRKLRLSGDRSELVDLGILRQMAPMQDEIATLQSQAPVNVAASISALESLSTIALSFAWPTEVVERLRDLLISLSPDDANSQHLRFLALRLSLNLTNENIRNCKIISHQQTITCLLRAIDEGFKRLLQDDGTENEQRTINLDLLVLSVGVMTNLAQHSKTASGYAATIEARPLLSSIADIFQQGQKRLIEAESVEQGVNNVAYGYLAVMLADLCRDRQARTIIASRLPHGNLNALVDAVEEFVSHHQSVDRLNFAGEEGGEVWSAFTEKLRGVLDRLKVEAEKME